METTLNMDRRERLDLIVVGSGPCGLAAAIAAGQAGLRVRVLEKGTLANSIYHFPEQMTFYTTADKVEIGGVPLTTINPKPTRLEYLNYLTRVVGCHGLDVRTGQAVVNVVRQDGGGFVVSAVDQHQHEIQYAAHAVVLATGYYDNPNRLGIAGEDLPHVSHYFRSAHPYFDQDVAIVGGGNSAVQAALEIWRYGGRPTLYVRGEEFSRSLKYWVRPDIENRVKEGSIEVRFGVELCEISEGKLAYELKVDPPSSLSRRTRSLKQKARTAKGNLQRAMARQVLLLTGYRPDVDLLERVGVAYDAQTLQPIVDGETFETSVSGVYAAGGINAGCVSWAVFIEDGRLHGERIAQHILQQRA